MYLIKLLLIVTISYFILTTLFKPDFFNKKEFMSEVKYLSGNNNLKRFPKCLLKSDIGLRLFYLLEKNGKLDQTVLPYVYNQMICLSNELKTGAKSKATLNEKYLKALKNTGYKMNTTNVNRFAYAIIERETELIALHPDDIHELIETNNKFYKMYLTNLKLNNSDLIKNQ